MNWRLALTGVFSVAAIGLLGVAVTGGSAAPAPSAPVTISPTAVATPDATLSAASPAPAPAAAPAVAKVVPKAVQIPALNIESSLIPLGLNPDKTIQVPPVSTPLQAGWWSGGAVPGDVGAAVLLGHTDGDHMNGVFHDIRLLNLGDEITVDRSDGTTVTFKVTKVQTIAKTRFPSEAVYGPTKDSELRLVTCGGKFDPQAKSYVSSVIVFAKLKS